MIRILKKVIAWLKRKVESVRLIHKQHTLRKFQKSKPIFILGVQKSGTTAISALLSEATGTTVTLDIIRAIKRPEGKILRAYGVEDYGEFLYKYRKEFSRKLIKEPSLTFDYHKLKKYFPSAKFVMILREPKDNIRSILNRLKIPGNLEDLDYSDWPELRGSLAWRINLISAWQGYASHSYVDSLAYKWRLATNIYLENQSDFILIKYEEFLLDKRGTVEKLAEDLGLKVVNDISGATNRQYQRKGNKVKDYQSYYGNNISYIYSQCGTNARTLGYWN